MHTLAHLVLRRPRTMFSTTLGGLQCLQECWQLLLHSM